MRIPNDDEINRAAQQLGYADENGVCPRKHRAYVARTLMNAVAEETRTAARAADTAALVRGLADLHEGLAAALPPDAATAITAALAPSLYRSAIRERTSDAQGKSVDQPR
ncbi:hypothetical protein ACTD5D_39770 [Nocardia takedensis]|uniref:hypothetical protein n=1 Tax=Nocardia takedensis TaxID=259390 RepID=UPI003F76F9FE